MDSLKNTTQKISWLLVQAGIIFIPLWVNIFAFNAYENKIFIFIGLIDMLCVLWLIGSGRLKNALAEIYYGAANIKFWSLEFLLICYWLAYSLATIFAINRANSFYGNEYRLLGLLFITHLVLFFFLITPLLTTDRSRKIFKLLSITSIPICIYAILQYFGIDFANYLTPFVVIYNGTMITRAFSTFGHPNYLATFLVMILPYSCYLLLINQKLTKRIFYLFIIVFQLAALIFTMTRSAWAAAIASLALFIFLIYKTTKSRRVLTTFVALIIIFAVALGAIGFKRLNQPLRDSSLILRLTEWKYAGEQIIKRPILGYGPDNYQLLAMQRPMSAAEKKIDSAVADRVHNIILDTAINIGFVGLIIYLLIWVKAIQLWHRSTHCHPEFNSGSDNANNLLPSAILCSLIGYFIVLLFNFDFSVSLILFFINLAMLNSSYLKENIHPQLGIGSGCHETAGIKLLASDAAMVPRPRRADRTWARERRGARTPAP